MMTDIVTSLEIYSYGALSLTLILLSTGCYDNSPPPVAPPIIEANRVTSIEADVTRRRACIIERDVIERCVADLSRLSYKPTRNRQDAGPDATITLKDENGAVIVEYGLFCDEEGSISVQVPPSRVSYVVFEHMPTIERVMSYAVFDAERELLGRMANYDQWDRRRKDRAGDGVRKIGRYCPAASMAVPSSPEELRQSLEAIKGISAKDIDKFVPYYDLNRGA
jgi:hypothetical protein